MVPVETVTFSRNFLKNITGLKTGSGFTIAELNCK